MRHRPVLRLRRAGAGAHRAAELLLGSGLTPLGPVSWVPFVVLRVPRHGAAPLGGAARAGGSVRGRSRAAPRSAEAGGRADASPFSHVLAPSRSRRGVSEAAVVADVVLRLIAHECTVITLVQRVSSRNPKYGRLIVRCVGAVQAVHRRGLAARCWSSERQAPGLPVVDEDGCRCCCSPGV